MHKIIHPNFEIDLSTTEITLTDENHWFSDVFFTKYSFPFFQEWTDELQIAFENLIDYNSKENTIEFEVIYVFNNVMEKGILTIEEQILGLNMQLKYGIEEFPNFNKKLSEIGLQSITVADIYAHAKVVIGQTWPAVNYNFPQIHTDKIDTTIAMWTFFQKILNNYKLGDFVTNTVVDTVPHNRNLMQPLPYFLHIMTQGFAQAGYTLKGDVLEIPTLKKKLLYTETNYHEILDQVNINTSIMGSEKTFSSGNRADFLKTILLPQGGKYQVTGTINIYGRWKEYARATLKYRGKTIWTNHKYEKRHHSGYMYSYDVDVIFDTINDGAAHNLIFESSQFNKNENLICDFSTTSLFLYNASGAAIPNVVNNNTVDLSRLVPDATFGSFVTVIKNWYNLDIDLRGKEIWMNFIEKEINYNNPFDLSDFETIPTRTYNKGASFLLKFADAGDEKNNHPEMFFNADGFSNNSIPKDDKTTEIQIQAFPLPNAFRNGVQTAYAIESVKNKVYAVMYDGLNAAGLNLTDEPAPMMLPEVVDIYYKNWFDFRLASVPFKWSFTAFTESLNGLTAKRKIFAFSRYHLIKTISKRQISKDLFDVEVESYTLK
jgi:hypothetical protein